MSMRDESLTIDLLLQQCTVRLDLPETGQRGTGFLVAQGWILTCEHVIRGASGPVQVTGSRGEEWGTATITQIVSRSDLTLLSFNPPVDRNLPAVSLDRSFQPLDRLYIYGYPSEFPNGASVTADCEGSAEDEGLSLIKFKAGQFQPGISGAPVLNLRSGQVCGVVKFTRDRSSDLGGGAIPVATVLQAFLFLASLQQAFHQVDRRWFQAWTTWQQSQPPVPHPPVSSPTTVSENPQPPAVTVNTLKAQGLQRQIAALQEEYQAVTDALMAAIDPIIQTRYRRKLAQLEAELTDLAHQLDRLDRDAAESQVPENSENSDSNFMDRLITPQTVPSLPLLPLESVEGAVPLESGFYIPRSSEAGAYTALAQPHALLRIKAPHGMGKSSLVMRVMEKARELGNRTAWVDFQQCDRDCFSSNNQFLQWFSAVVGRELRVKAKPMDDWDDMFGPNTSCSDFFEAHLLQEPLVIALDNFDRIFDYPSIDVGFWGLLRAWHEAGKHNSKWANLRLVLAYSMDSYTPKAINQSPFNVGTDVPLSEFTLEEAIELGQRHGLGAEVVQAVMGQVQGYPQLLRRAFYSLAQGELSLAELKRVAATEEGPFGEHLRGLLGSLEQQRDLWAAMLQLGEAKQPLSFDTATSMRLEGLGLVRRSGNGLVVRNPLYQAYFRDRLKR
ncbi:MAG: AAA-like domain-containing protein [Prochlorothrix sp.]